MQDLRKIAAERAARPKENPVGTSFVTEHKRAKKALVKQIEALDGSNIRMIAANTDEEGGEKKILRVAAYCRVSTDDLDQAISIALQIKEYKKKIKSNPNWQYVGTYVDDGFSGTNTEHREGFKKLMADALDGKIDLIITKAVSRFARNLMDCIVWVEALQNHDPPVRVYFEQENLDTMAQTSSIILIVLATELSDALSGYLSESDLTGYLSESDMGEYVTESDLSDALGDYLSESDLTGYITEGNLSSYLSEAIASYVSDSLGDVVTASYLSEQLGQYVSSSYLSEALSDYLSESDLSEILSDALSDYISASGLSDALSNYSTTAELEDYIRDQNYVSEDGLSYTLSGYLSDSDVSSYLSEGLAGLTNLLSEGDLASGGYVSSSSFAAALEAYLTENGGQTIYDAISQYINPSNATE